MIDSIGLGSFLVSFASACGLIVFVISFLALRYLFKLRTIPALIVGVVAGVIGFLASPYFFVLL